MRTARDAVVHCDMVSVHCGTVVCIWSMFAGKDFWQLVEHLTWRDSCWNSSSRLSCSGSGWDCTQWSVINQLCWVQMSWRRFSNVKSKWAEANCGLFSASFLWQIVASSVQVSWAYSWMLSANVLRQDLECGVQMRWSLLSEVTLGKST